MIRSFVIFVLEFFADCQQEDTDNYNGNKDICFPGQLFFQEDAGEQQGNDAHRGENRGCNCVYTAEGVNIGKLTGGFKYCGEDLIFMLRDRAELNLLGLHEDEQTQSEQG